MEEMEVGPGPSSARALQPWARWVEPIATTGPFRLKRKVLLARKRCGRAAGVLSHGEAAMLEVAVKSARLSGLLAHGRSPDQGAPLLALAT